MFQRMRNIGLMVMAFLLFPFLVTAQKEEWGKHRLKFTPTRLINAFHPGLELGYEYCYGRFSSQVSAAYLFNSTVFVYNSLSGYHLKFEEKFFIKRQPRNNRIKFYSSVEICYNDVNNNQNHLFLPAEAKQMIWSEREKYVYKDDFDLKRKAVVTNMKFGIQIKPKKANKIIIEPCGGIGINFQNVSHYNRPPNDMLFYEEGSIAGDIDSFTEYEGFSVLLNLTLAFRIGYIF